MKKLIIFLSVMFITTLSYAQWTKNYFSDEFGDKTDKVLIIQKCSGTFSNSATVNSELTVDVIMYFKSSAPMLRFNLYEYNRGPIVESTDNLTVKTSDGIVYSFSIYGIGVFLRNEDDPMYKLINSMSEKRRKKSEESYKKFGVTYPDHPSVLLELLTNETLPIKFFISAHNGRTYNFIVNPVGFVEAYNDL